MTVSQSLEKKKMLFSEVYLEITTRRRWSALTKVQSGVQIGAHMVEKLRHGR